uniref:Heat shock protein family A member 12 variant X9 n=1 Tax=Urechis unicinctus TaxID=6432 RepID=A0AAU0MTU7_UREUN
MDRPYVMVAAIDLGTTYSGYTFSTTYDQNTIYSFNKWGTSVNIPFSQKTPTCLLTDQNLQFVAMGYEAQRQYKEMDDEILNFRYFEGFKMSLHLDKNINQDIVIQDSTGLSCPALDIFAMMLRELRNHLIEQVKCCMDSVPTNCQIRWVVTVPAIWTDAAKQFMRMAAVKAGLVDIPKADNLLIALEPEVASMYCAKLPLKEFASSPTTREFKEGLKYVVIDAGGGTLDVTVHELLTGGRLTELHCANGGAMGAHKVNVRFIEVLRRVFKHHDFIDKCRSESPGVFLDLQCSFETIKRCVDPEKKNSALIPINMELSDLHRELYGESIVKSITPDYQKQGVRVRSGMLTLPYSVLLDIFSPVVDDVVTYVCNLLTKPELDGVETVLLVGGFSDCVLLQKSLQQALRSDLAILVPNDAWSAVLKGAVMFGHDPTWIHGRKSQRTYGIAGMVTFNPLYHRLSQRITLNERELVRNAFVMLIQKGEPLRSITKRCKPAAYDTKFMDFKIYATPKKIPTFVDDAEAAMVAMVTVELEGCGIDREVEVEVKFDGPETGIAARDISGKGQVVKADINFFGQ